MKISIIVAIDKKRGIGKDNKLLWHIPEDLKRFKDITSGHTIIMGRKTFESIGRVLPNRTNIIITRDQNYKVEGAFIAHSLERAIEVAKEVEKKPEVSRKSHLGGVLYLTPRGISEIFIIGGGQIFEQALPFADKLYLTVVDGEYDADTFFPDYSEFKKVVFEQEGKSEEYKYKFLDLEK